MTQALQELLVPVELTDDAEAHLIDYASALAGRLGMALRLLHVFDVPGTVHPDVDAPSVKSYREHSLREKTAKLEAMAGAVGGDLPVLTELLPGIAHRRIQEVVARGATGLVVMRSHRRTGLLRAFLGSVAERVLRTVRVPVITVPRGWERTGVAAMLVPHDFSEGSARALARARTLQVPLGGARVEVVHVIPVQDDEEGPWAPKWVSQTQREAYASSLQAAIDHDVAQVFGPTPSRVDARILHGDIIDLLLGIETDLIVIGASGKDAVERFLLGSVTLELLRRSHVPVLTVP